MISIEYILEGEIRDVNDYVETRLDKIEKESTVSDIEFWSRW